MAETYSAGVVTAYGAAVRGGYTGTYEEFCAEQAKFAENAAAVAQAKEDVETMQGQVEQAAATFTDTTVPAAVTTVQEAGAAQVQAVQSEGTMQAEAVETVGAQQTAAVGAAGSDAVAAVEAAETAATDAVTAAQTAAVQAVQTESATQQAAVQAKGEQTIASIPEDYTALSDELDDVKSAFDSEISAISNQAEIVPGVVNYGYNEYVDIPAEPTSGVGTRRVGIKRAFGQITLNIPVAATYLVRIKISGDVEKASNDNGVKSWTGGINLIPGHIYKIVTKLVSGSVSAPEGVNPPLFSVVKVGSATGLGTIKRDGYNSEYTFVAPNDAVHVLAYIYTNTTTDNAVYQVVIRDKSAIIGDDSDIPQTLPEAQPSSSGEIVIPAIIHSEELVNYNCNIDGTKRAATQGICSDGIRYLFFPARQYAGYDADDEAPVMVKWDTVTNAPVVVNANAPKSYGHIDDMCFVPASVPGIDNGNVDRLYLTDMNRSTAAGYTGAVHVVDANTLEFITTVQTYDQYDNSKNLVSTALAPYWHGVYHVGYSPEREMFFVHSGGLTALDPDNRLNQTLAILDKNGSVIKGLRLVRSAGTIFGCDCDANYIYIAIYSTGETEGTFDIRLAVFDWNLNPITSVIVDQKVWEVEGTCHIGNTFFFSWLLPAGTARTGCYVTKQTYKKNHYFDQATTFPVDWVENQFHVASFEPFTA